MTEHEFDFTDCDTVRVTIGQGRVSVVGYHPGGATESVSVDLPTAGVTWHDERDVLELPVLEDMRGQDWRARYNQLWRVWGSRLHADEGLIERLIAAEAEAARLRDLVRELVPWARGGAASGLVGMDRRSDRITLGFDPETLERVDRPGARELLERLDAGEFDL